ncbi:unnamed protein product [Mytilus coruscus]|uniref:CHRNN n=1 Tax=Mytilus coruscus TaxID=42192 RepID=A0A6J8CZT2_MYTCO|nr:unnamed protein product [Mytilus coruscus]
MPLSGSAPLTVTIQFNLNSLISFKEVDETVSIIGVMTLNWIDPALTWNPLSYNNVSKIIIDPFDLWLPPIFLMNGVEKMESIGSDTLIYTTVILNGQVYYSPGAVLQGKCPASIARFPFDTKECTFSFLPWGITNDSLELSSLYEHARLDWYTPNSDWILQEYSTNVGHKTVDSYSYDMFYLKITVKRQSLYYAVMIILPTFVFALLNPLVFILPVESGERISLAVTMLLSYTIFLTIVSESIPVSSNPMCGLLIVMITIIVVSCLIVSCVIIGSRYANMDNFGEVSTIVKRLTKWFIQKRNNAISKKIMPLPEVNGKSYTSDINVTGKDVAASLDIIFLSIFYMTICICFFTYFLYVVI